MISLSPSQSAGVDKVLDLTRKGAGLLSISGPAGSGKTTLVKALVDNLDDVAVCTPTNKAAQVLQSKGIDATTFYRRFFITEERKGAARGKLRFQSCRRFLENIVANSPFQTDWKGQQFRLPPGKLGYVNVMVADESSMITSRSIASMREMCDTLILVGDHGQLPPVGDNDYPAGYFGTLDHTVVLTEIHRQKEGSLILDLATAIRESSPKVPKMLRHFEPQESFDEWLFSDPRTIAFTNRERQRVNFVTRRLLGFDIPTPQATDKLIVLNNFNEDLINGTEVCAKRFEWDGRSRVAQIEVFDPIARVSSWQPMDMAAFIGDQIQSQQEAMGAEDLPWMQYQPPELETPALELTYGYCITAHKSQGSEFNAVAVLDQVGLIKKIAASTKAKDRRALDPEEQARRWLYTAASRAKQELRWAPTWWVTATGEVV